MWMTDRQKRGRWMSRGGCDRWVGLVVVASGDVQTPACRWLNRVLALAQLARKAHGG